MWRHRPSHGSATAAFKNARAGPVNDVDGGAENLDARRQSRRIGRANGPRHRPYRQTAAPAPSDGVEDRGDRLSGEREPAGNGFTGEPEAANPV